MNYRDYIDLSREELLEKVAAAMSDKRFRHVLGVEQAALDLAERYNAPVELGRGFHIIPPRRPVKERI